MATVACGVLSPEEQLLTDFFEASRLYDTSVMARLSAVAVQSASRRHRRVFRDRAAWTARTIDANA